MGRKFYSKNFSIKFPVTKLVLVEEKLMTRESFSLRSTMVFTTKETGLEWGDYVAFTVLCLSSCAGGLWYSAIGSRTKKIVDIKDYLLGGKKMSTFPVAMSLIASYVSGVTILGTPAEIYNYGTQYYLVVVGIAMSCCCVAIVYLPVFCTLKLSSSYEYLELRFNRHVRAVASILFLLDEILFLPMVVYVPALAFNQLTGFNEFAVAGIMVLICGLYTALGGLRAVVWTDCMQTGIMFIGVILVAVAGTLAAGGLGEVLSNAAVANRLDLKNWDFSPYERQTGWGAIIGGFIYWTCFNSVNQTMVQRYIALPTKRKAYAALGIFALGAILSITLCVLCGLAAFSAFLLTGCDYNAAPLTDDRLLPSFVIWTSKVQHLPGLAGVFLAGVFGAGLSSLSAVLNACALVAVEDLLRGWLRLRLKPLTEGILARSITALLAVISIIMLLVIRQLGGVLGVATALSAIAASTTCGIFTLGMVFWWVGPRGAIVGAIAGALTAGTVTLGSQYAAAKGLRAYPKDFSDACPAHLKYKPPVPDPNFDPSTVFPLFRVSYHWIAPMGLLATLTVGAIVGWLWDTRHDDDKKDAELYTPCIWRFLPKEYHQKAGDVRRRHARQQAERSARAHSSPLILGKASDSEHNKAENVEPTEVSSSKEAKV